MATGTYQIFNPYKFPLQSVALQLAAGELNSGGLVVGPGETVTGLSQETAEACCATGVFILSRDGGKTWEEDGKIGPRS